MTSLNKVDYKKPLIPHAQQVSAQMVAEESQGTIGVDGRACHHIAERLNKELKL